MRFMTMSIRIFLLTMILLWAGSCGNDSIATEEKRTEGQESEPLAIPRFERDSAYNFVARQVAFGPRKPNSEGHAACRQWLVDQLSNFGADVIEQSFTATAYTGEELKATNIIGQFNKKAQKRILLAAHWDTRHIADSKLSTERQDEPILGADDGGSGVGVLLEVARNLGANPINNMGVDIVLFDVEDYGDSRDDRSPQQTVPTWAMGAQYWSRNMHATGFKFGILLDMVGAKNARFPKEGNSMEFAGPYTEKVWNLAQRMSYGNYFADVRIGGITDDHLFVNTIAKIPMLDIINVPANGEEQTFGDHWHTHNDNMDIIDKRTLGAVGQVVMAVVYREANGTF